MPEELKIFILEGAKNVKFQKLTYEHEKSGYLIELYMGETIPKLSQKYNFLLFKASWTRLSGEYNDLFSLKEVENAKYQAQITQETDNGKIKTKVEILSKT